MQVSFTEEDLIFDILQCRPFQKKTYIYQNEKNCAGNLAKEIASAFDAAKTKMRISHEVIVSDVGDSERVRVRVNKRE